MAGASTLLSASPMPIRSPKSSAAQGLLQPPLAPAILHPAPPSMALVRRLERRQMATTSWTITSGAQYCQLSNGGACVTDGAGDYGNNEQCTMRAEVPMVLSTNLFDTEAGYDKLTIAGVQYSGYQQLPDGLQMEIGDVMTWSSDVSVPW